MKNKLNKLGIILSLGCLIHCIVLPFLPVLPLVGAVSTHNIVFHLWMIILVIMFSMPVIIFGFYKHNNIEPILLIGAGLVFLIAGSLMKTFHIDHAIIFNVSGSLLMATAHYKNHKLKCFCKHHRRH
jgi:hypothetical protein